MGNIKPDSSQRIFVALPVPEQARTSLLALNQFFPERQFAKNLHLTLEFIGHVADPQPYILALQKVRAKTFELRITRLSTFRRAILAALADASQGLLRLKELVDKALEQTGHSPENRKFLPHITLCRSKRSSARHTDETAALIKPDIHWQADKFHLYHSTLTPAGAIHKILSTYSLV